MIDNVQRFEASCDECGTEFEGSRGCGGRGTRYTDRVSLDRALLVSEWSVSVDGLLCPQCGREAVCVGHQWDEWSPIDLPPNYRGKVRHCTLCGGAEFDPATWKGFVR